jgi:acyl phosphate:glycerol-3-phosphate acyltransferase
VRELLIKVLASYLTGSVLGSLVVGRLRGGVDIRGQGSGNPGSANALRTRGKVFAAWVLAIDMGKGWLATHVIAPLPVPHALSDPRPSAWLAVSCGLAVVLGHLYPVWFGFRGGKGVATLFGAVLGLRAAWLLPMLLTWGAALALTGYVGLASILAACALCAVLLITDVPPRLPLQVFGVLSVLLVVFTHRANIARMRAGREPRVARLRLSR